MKFLDANIFLVNRLKIDHFCDDIRILNFMFTQISHVIQYQNFFLASTRNK